MFLKVLCHPGGDGGEVLGDAGGQPGGQPGAKHPGGDPTWNLSANRGTGKEGRRRRSCAPHHLPLVLLIVFALLGKFPISQGFSIITEFQIEESDCTRFGLFSHVYFILKTKKIKRTNAMK